MNADNKWGNSLPKILIRDGYERVPSITQGYWIFSEGGAWQETEGWYAFPNLLTSLMGKVFLPPQPPPLYMTINYNRIH